MAIFHRDNTLLVACFRFGVHEPDQDQYLGKPFRRRQVFAGGGTYCETLAQQLEHVFDFARIRIAEDGESFMVKKK
jgi:hypothetical protein